jgi:hypothetical protein
MGQCFHLYDCLPFNWSVCPPLWLSTIQWVSVSTVHLYDCLPFSGSVCPLSTFMTVYHSVCQCVHCPPLWLSTIQWVSVSTFLTEYHSMGKCPVQLLNCLPFSGSVCPPFWLSTIQWVSVSIGLSLTKVAPRVASMQSSLSLCWNGPGTLWSRPGKPPSSSTRVYKESSYSGKVSCSPALHLFTWLKSSS